MLALDPTVEKRLSLCLATAAADDGSHDIHASGHRHGQAGGECDDVAALGRREPHATGKGRRGHDTEPISEFGGIAEGDLNNGGFSGWTHGVHLGWDDGMERTQYLVLGTAAGIDSFAEAAAAHALETDRSQLVTFGAGSPLDPETIFVTAKAGATILSTGLAACLVAWINARAKRKVVFTEIDAAGRQVSREVTGYSTREIKELLGMCREVRLIEHNDETGGEE